MRANCRTSRKNLEQGAQEEQLRPVGFTMSVLAVLLAVTTVMGERTHADAIINQNKAADQWSEYQAQKIRDYDTQLATDLLSVVALHKKDATAKMTKAYADHEKKWAAELKQDQASAEALQASVDPKEKRALTASILSEVLLEIGLVITSVTLLTRSRIYWYLGMASSAIGVAAGVSAFFLK